MLLRYLTQPSAVVEALPSGICLQVLQGNFVDVVVSVQTPEPITPTTNPVEESSEVRHRTLDQILKGLEVEERLQVVWSVVVGGLEILQQCSHKVVGAILVPS